MSCEIGPPVIQPLGFQGEEFLLKVTFPIREVVPQTEDTDDFTPSYWAEPVVKRGIILKFKAEDLPLHRYDATLLRFDLSQVLRNHFGKGD